METTIIVGIVSSLLSGGLVGVITNYLLKNRKQSSEDFVELLRAYKEDNIALRESEKENSDRIRKLENEVNELRSKLMLMESAHYDLPLPQWLKDLDGTMLSFNTAYEDKFILPNDKNPSDYLGSTDSEFWGEEIGREYLANDKKVMRAKKLLHLTETVKVFGGKNETWEVYKYPRYAGRVLIGIGGIAFKPVKKEPS